MASTVGQVIKCKAAVAWKAREPLVIEEVEVAPPKKMEVRIKILYTSLCRADIYCWKDKAQKQIFPRILGHEAGGIVESIGEGVTDIAPGDHVLSVFTGECRESSHNKNMECIMCSTLRNITDRDRIINHSESRFSINEKPIYQFVGTSTFIEYTVVNVDCVAKIDLQAPLDIVCILSCGISTGLSAALNVAKPPWGSTVAIFGLGDVGLAAAEGARITGASRIIGIDMNPERLKKAKKLGGFNDLVNPISHESPIQEVLVEMTNGGVDRSIECTGNTSAMISAFECTHDGRVVLVGVPDKDVVFQTHSFNLLDEGILERKIFRYKKPRYDLSMLVELYFRQDLYLEKFITHEVPFSEINKAFDYMLHGDSIRCIIHMDA